MFRICTRPADGAGALGAARNQVQARDLAGSAPTIKQSWTGGAVLDLCAAYPPIPSFVVMEREVIRLVECERALFPGRATALVRSLKAPAVRPAVVVHSAMPIEGDKALIACRYPQTISSGFPIVEQGRGIGYHGGAA